MDELVWLVSTKPGFGLGDLVVEISMVLLEMILLEMVLLEMILIEMVLLLGMLILSEFVGVIDCIEHVEGLNVVAIHR